MRNRCLSWAIAIVVCFMGAASRSDAGQSSSAGPYAGTWAGTWDGAGSGEFELTLDKTKEGGLAGRVAVTSDGGNYTADLRGVSFDGKKMTTAYDFPLDPSSEIAVTGTFEDRAAKGTWSLHPRGQDTEIAGGTWTVARK
jgi:hypothetical protein